MTAAPIRLAKCSHSDCQSAAVRYLPGSRRTFYCDKHGPTSIEAWNRLMPLAVLELPTELPLPPLIDTALRHLADAIRQSLDTARPVNRDEADREYAEREALYHENQRLRQQVAEAEHRIQDLEKLAADALAEVPLAEPLPVPIILPEPINLTPMNGETHDPAPPPRHEKRVKLPKVPKPPKPEPDRWLAPLDPLQIPDPPMDVLQEADLVTVLNKYMPTCRETPPLVANGRALDEWDELDVHDRQRVFGTLKRLAAGRKYVDTYRLPPGARLKVPGKAPFMLKAGHRLRIILSFIDTVEIGPALEIYGFMDRADRSVFSSEA